MFRELLLFGYQTVFSVVPTPSTVEIQIDIRCSTIVFYFQVVYPLPNGGFYLIHGVDN